MLTFAQQPEQYHQQQTQKRKYVKIKRRKIGEKGESESESYQPDIHQSKKHGLPIKEIKTSAGCWNLEENREYLKFMEENRIDFETEKNRRRTKVFYRLSKVLKKRTPDQCRSHHQKLQIKYHDNLDLIMEAVKQKIAEQAPSNAQQGLTYKEKDNCNIKQTLATAQVNDDDQSTLMEIIVDFNLLVAW